MENRTVRKTAQRLTLTWAGVALSVLLVALGIGGTPRLALAHAELKSSTPANGATVQQGLTQITLLFDEEIGVDKSTAELVGPNGSAVPGVTVAVDRAERSKMTIQTPALTVGAYTVKWSAFSEDDNNLANGTVSFTVASSGQGVPRWRELHLARYQRVVRETALRSWPLCWGVLWHLQDRAWCCAGSRRDTHHRGVPFGNYEL